MSENHDELSKKIEALLFATQGLTVKKICEVLKSDENNVINVLNELKDNYKSRDSAFIITDIGELWKLTVQSEHVPLVKDLIPSEFPKSLLETLAVIAWKNPAIQGDVIKLRGNKAYDHIKYLEDAGLVGAKPKGRSRELKLTDKFYEYFNSDPQNVKKQFDKANNK